MNCKTDLKENYIRIVAILLINVFLYVTGVPNVSYAATNSLSSKIVIEKIDEIAYRDGQTFITFKQSAQVGATHNASSMTLGSIDSKRKTAVKQKSGRMYYLFRAEKGSSWKLVGEADPFSAWNTAVLGKISKYNAEQLQKTVPRYVIKDQGNPLDANAGLFVYTPKKATATTAKYAVVSVPRKLANSLKTYTGMNQVLKYQSKAVVEQRKEMAYKGVGKPVLQRIEHPKTFNGVNGPTLYYYTRWEGGANSNVESKACDYLVAINTKVVEEKNLEKAPLGLHLHCYGGNLETGYGLWADAKDGTILLAANQDPYDWWTGYHEKIIQNKPLKNSSSYKTGFVRPYTESRLISIVEWMKQGNGPLMVDKNEIFTAGASMGGSGALMLAYRHPDVFSWCRSWAGVHDPHTSNMQDSYAKVYGPYNSGSKMKSGESPWTYYSDTALLKKNVSVNLPFVAVSNGKNDNLIGWSQAVSFAKALQQAKQPHVFRWGQNGHNQRVYYPLNQSTHDNPMVIRKDKSLPAFTNCSLDDELGNGTQSSGSAEGQLNAYLYWDATTSEETTTSWTMPIGLIKKESCTVDITPRNCKVFKAKSKTSYYWALKENETDIVIAEGNSEIGKDGLLTIKDVPIKKGLQVLYIEAL